MKINRGKAGRALCAVFITAILGLALFVPAVLILSLSGVSPYWTRAAAAVGLAALAAGAAVGSDLLGRRGRRGVGLVFLAVCLTSAVYVGHGVWRDSIPTVDDRTLLLWEYEPYAPDTKAVRLAEEPTLRLEGAVLTESFEKEAVCVEKPVSP